MRRFNPLPLIGAAIFMLAFGPVQLLHAQGCTNVFTHNSLPSGVIPTGIDPGGSPTFTDQGIALSFGVYQGPNGPQYGTALAESASAEFGFTQVLALQEISAVYSLSQALPAGTNVQQVVVFFQDLNPGPEEIRVNDASPVFWNITDLMAAPNLPLAPGIEVAIDMEPGSTTVGKLILTGNVGSLKLGGMDLKLDDVCINPNEDPNGGGGGIPGCTYEVAINFDPNATIDNGSCQFVTCPDACETDLDQDGICDEEDPCVGIVDALGICGGSCPYDLDGDGECDDVDCCVGGYDECGVCNGPGAIFDCGCTAIPLGACDCEGNQLDALGICGGDCTADVDGDGICDLVDDCVGMLDVCGVCNGPGPIFDCGCFTIPPEDCDCEGNQLDAIGICGGNCIADTDMDGVCDNQEIPGCTNVLACNYNVQATDDDGSCQIPPPGYDCTGLCISDIDGDGICDEFEIPGCSDPIACNFFPESTDNSNCIYPSPGFDCMGNCLEDADDDGICDVLEVFGCTDQMACNFNPEATENVENCIYPPAGLNCDGSCTADSDGDGICDFYETVGCMDDAACNYNPAATESSADCIYPETGYDCTGSCFDYDDDGICNVDEVGGCTYPNAINFNEGATDEDGSCQFNVNQTSCPDLDGDGSVAVSDLLVLLGSFGSNVDCCQAARSGAWSELGAFATVMSTWRNRAQSRYSSSRID